VTLFREKTSEHQNLTDADKQYHTGLTYRPVHDALVEVLRVLATLVFPHPVVGLVVKHIGERFMRVLGGRLQLQGEITHEKSIGDLVT